MKMDETINKIEEKKRDKNEMLYHLMSLLPRKLTNLFFLCFAHLNHQRNCVKTQKA